MRKVDGWLLGCFLLATTLCIFGQGLAYFLTDHVLSIAPVYYLTGLTATGIGLYLITGIIVAMLFRKKEFLSEYREIFLLLMCITIPSASIWAFFVTAMWWG